MELKLVSLETLRRMFEEHSAENPVLIRKNCSDCGCQVEIELHKTSGGFGLHGGVLCEVGGKIVAKCVDCHSK